jgi:tRNA(Ile)-lysidine synthase
MVSSKKQSKSNLTAKKDVLILSQLRLFLKAFFRRHHLLKPSLLIAYSGGLDSTVLLHAFHQLQSEIPFHLHVMHVHHGLSENADDWASFCEKTCVNLHVPFEMHTVRVDQRSGLGTEAAARQARYDALNSFSADFICLGHHQDDQAETLLLQLARGAGVKGLSGMAQIDIKRRLIRPLLNVSRADILAYAKQHQLQWIDDESNQNLKFDRNFIRHVLIPTFQEQYKSITKTLARSAMHMADASAMLDELAEMDAALVVENDGQYGVLKLDILQTLSIARQGNLVRWWFSKNKITMPSAVLLQQVLQQLQSARADATIKVKVADHLHVMRYKKFGYLVCESKNEAPINLLWQGEELVVLPNRSRLLFTIKQGQGFAFQRGGSDIKLRIKNREGGEHFKPALGRPKRSLKTMMQSSAIPPWQRTQLPLIFMDETLVIIPNVGVDAEMQAQSHEMGLSVNWEPYLNAI